MLEFYRRDQADGITPPNLADRSSHAEHIVHARGKRTRFTSLSIDPTIVEFGPQLRSDYYQAGLRLVEPVEQAEVGARMLSTGKADQEPLRAR